MDRKKQAPKLSILQVNVILYAATERWPKQQIQNTKQQIKWVIEPNHFFFYCQELS